MPETPTRLYEGLFLFNQAVVGSDEPAARQALEEILHRAQAEIVTIYKWDDRRLAYPIRSQRRGLYLLAYFHVRGSQIPNIERDVNLSESILRCMVIRADHIGEVELEQAREKAAVLSEPQTESERDSEEQQPQAVGASADVSQSAEGGRSESEAAPGPQPQNTLRSTPAESESPTAAPESGDRAPQSE